MTPREIVLANIEHKPAPRCGMSFHRNRLNDLHGAGAGAPFGYSQKRWQEGDLEYYDDEYGNIWARKVGGSAKGEIHRPVLEDWSQLKDLKIPHYDRETVAGNYRRGFENAGDRFKIAWVGGWIFNDARYLRKLEIYLMDMALYPDELKKLHEMIAVNYRIKIQAAADAGADAIGLAEDMGTQKGLLFSPQMWREYFRDLYTELFGMAHEAGMKVMMHSCGYNWAILRDLLEAGVDVFQFDQPLVYDIDALAALLDEYQAALWSPVDIQKVLPTGDRALIEAGARQMCKTFEGRLICKNYPDLRGIGVRDEWDDWAYQAICEYFNIPTQQAVSHS